MTIHILKPIDDFLNKITMYRLTWYGLLFLLIVALVLSFFGELAFGPINLVFSGVLIFLICIVTNQLFAFIYHAPSNRESVYITAFILTLIINPPASLNDIFFLTWASVLAIASKYILAVGKKHLFNPAALAIVITGFAIGRYASWWVGTLWMAPFVLVVGFLITRKIKRADLVISFLAVSSVLVLGNTFLKGQDLVFMLKQMVIDSPWMFLAFVMLTEPMTTPPVKSLRIVYGALVGILFVPFVNILGFYFTPEMALVAGNIFSYFVSPKEKLLLKLKEKIKIADNTYDFIFRKNQPVNFKPGQYMEWTLAHEKQDSRGIRRYFTIASSPTEQEIRLGVKFYDKPSSYKRALDSLNENSVLVATQLAGDFTLPADTTKKLVFIAGGIGVTPFRSMVKYLLDKNEKRDIVMFYANTRFTDIAYHEVFNLACDNLGMKLVHVISKPADVPDGFLYETGMVTGQMIKERVPDFKERMFYISGPRAMITSFERTLSQMGVPRSQIKTDFFPGFA